MTIYEYTLSNASIRCRQRKLISRLPQRAAIPRNLYNRRDVPIKTVYYDATTLNECIGVLSSSIKVMAAGTTIYSMPCNEKNNEYEKYAKEYDIHFIFADIIPHINFYTIPQVDIMATDSLGGFI